MVRKIRLNFSINPRKLSIYFLSETLFTAPISSQLSFLYNSFCSLKCQRCRGRPRGCTTCGSLVIRILWVMRRPSPRKMTTSIMIIFFGSFEIHSKRNKMKHNERVLNILFGSVDVLWLSHRPGCFSRVHKPLSQGSWTALYRWRACYTRAVCVGLVVLEWPSSMIL